MPGGCTQPVLYSIPSSLGHLGLKHLSWSLALANLQHYPSMSCTICHVHMPKVLSKGTLHIPWTPLWGG